MPKHLMCNGCYSHGALRYQCHCPAFQGCAEAMGRPPQLNLRSSLLAVLLIGSLAWSGESVSWFVCTRVHMAICPILVRSGVVHEPRAFRRRCQEADRTSMPPLRLLNCS